MSFADAFARVIGIEGGYSNNPADAGGATKFGITEKLARAHGFQGDMQALTLGDAQAIYQAEFWGPLNLEQVDAISPKIASQLFDIAVHCGRSVPVPFLQRTLNLFNRQARDYSDLAVDGALGANTISALILFLRKRGNFYGEKVLLAALKCLQGFRYVELAERRPADEEFIFGWFLNRIVD